jgi:hypothetical protein
VFPQAHAVVKGQIALACMQASSWGVGSEWREGEQILFRGPWAVDLRKPKNATKKHGKSTKEEEKERTRLLCAFPLLQKKKDAEHDANKRIRLQLNNWPYLQRTWVWGGGINTMLRNGDLNIGERRGSGKRRMWPCQ